MDSMDLAWVAWTPLRRNGPRSMFVVESQKSERAPFWGGANLVDSSACDWVRSENGPRSRRAYMSRTTNESFRTWCNSEGSGTLIIMGENEYDRAYNCWASYAALDIVDDELVKSSTGVTSICASHVLGGKEHENKHLHVLSSLIYQILRANREIL
jgi:hypothetical protein